jgi:multidrug efflux pump subunit AcrB
VLFGLPVCVFGAFLSVSLVGLENNIYVQIGIVALMGLAAKNAILIVEFAKEYHEKQGMPLVDAAVAAAKLRFRPIMMTAFAFILGVVPLVIASGAGAAARVSIGLAVFGGMLFASTVGLFFIPMLYVLVQTLAYKLGGQKRAVEGSPGLSASAALGGGHA